MMRKILSTCAFVILTATAALGQPGQTLANSVGQPVYDLTNMKVGVIRGVTSELGSPYAIVSISNIGRASPPGAGNVADYRVLIPQESIQPRTAGGWLAALKSSSIARLRPYVPGMMPPG